MNLGIDHTSGSLSAIPGRRLVNRIFAVTNRRPRAGFNVILPTVHARRWCMLFTPPHPFPDSIKSTFFRPHVGIPAARISDPPIDRSTDDDPYGADFGISLAQLKSFLDSSPPSPAHPPPRLAHLAFGVQTDLKKGIFGNKMDVERRKRVFGANRLEPKSPVSIWELVWEALGDLTLIVLMVCGVLSLGLELTIGNGNGGELEWLEGAAILASVVVVVMVTATTNYQKESKFRELSSLNQDVKVRAIRNGTERELSTFELVVGDVVFIEGGDILQADGFLFEGDEVRVDESHLTGESDEVSKIPCISPYMFSGSKVLEGVGKMIVIGVGKNSKQGMIASLIVGDDPQQNAAETLRQTTVLTEKLESLAGDIGRFGVGAALVTFIAMAGNFSYDTFIVEGNSWDWNFLQHYLHHLITSITILVVAVPEGLPLAVTLALAFSVQKMMSDNNLVRHLDACETMGSTTTVCSDKTGTLTENDLTVKMLYTGGELYQMQNPNDSKVDFEGLDVRLKTLISEAISINSTAVVQEDPKTGAMTDIGNRTECGLIKFISANWGMDYSALRNSRTTLKTFPFSSSRKRMGIVAISGERNCMEGGDGIQTESGIFHVKGAAEIVLELCTKKVNHKGEVEPLSEKERGFLLPLVGKSEAGLRLLCLACREVELESVRQEDSGLYSTPDLSDLERDLVLLAIVGMSDTIRKEVPAAIKQCQRAGVVVKMLTGDNAETAASIAQQCGILGNDFEMRSSNSTTPHTTTTETSSQTGEPNASDPNKVCGKQHLPLVVEGPEFRSLVSGNDGEIDKERFGDVWDRLSVMARCSPEDKYLLVKGVQALGSFNGRSGEVIAMTGDGTNDAPALRIADVGFAMASGTPIARDASDILLLDDSFQSIVSALKWGRNVFGSVTKFLQFQLTVNVVAVVTACAGAIWLKESPLSAVQMLWVNLIMDSLASLSLATEPPSDSVLDMPPFRRDAPLISPLLLRNITGQAVFQLSVMYWMVFHGQELFGGIGQTHQFTLVFNVFVQMQLFNQVNARKIYDEGNVVEGLLDNKVFCGIWLAEFVLQYIIVQYGSTAFQTVPLNQEEWAICIGLGMLALPVREILRKIPTFNA